MKCKKSSGPKLILPKIIYKQSIEGNISPLRERLTKSHIHNSINDIIEKIKSLTYKKGQSEEVNVLKGLVKDLIGLSADYRKNQEILMTSSQVDDNIRFMKLKVHSMEADL
jgi:hypothetical protein